MGVRVEYKSMENGTKLATRVIALHDYEGNEREMAMSEENGENEAVVANNVDNSSTATTADNEAAENAEAGTVNDHDADDVNAKTDEDHLPQTASEQPLIGLMGLLALGAAGTLAARRRFRAS
jgi:LPXTG-motif cell wall-anchored protein